MATACGRYLRFHGKGAIVIFQVSLDGRIQVLEDGPSIHSRCLHDNLYVVVYPEALAAEGKAFWQHTGFGISSRCATFWLENSPFLKQGSGKHTHSMRLHIKEADDASVVIRKRIGVLLASEGNKVPVEAVYLYPTGMSAISHTAVALRGLCRDRLGACRVAVFG